MATIAPVVNGTQSNLKWVAAIIGLFAVLAALTIWSGVPDGDRALPFLLGASVMIGIFILYGAVTWHLLFRPMPVRSKRVQVSAASVTVRQYTAALLGVGSVAIIAGTFWDEVWHRQFGVPLGEDFFWRPHLLMYFGFASVILLGFAALLGLIRKGKGTFQQRFRANPVMGLLILTAGFLMYVLPADPLWHSIYGEDISAWSLPHLLIIISFVVIMLMSVALHVSTLPPRAWRGVHQVRLSDALPLLMFGAMILQWLQLLTTEWDAAQVDVAALARRPEWILPVVIALTGIFFGTLATRTLRLYGAATLSGILSLIGRSILIEGFNVDFMRSSAWLLVIPILISIDVFMVVWAGLRKISPSGTAAWVGSGIFAAFAMSAIVLPIMPQFYTTLTINNPLIAVIVIAIVSVIASGLGSTLGDYLAGQTEAIEIEEKVTPLRVPLTVLGALAAMCAFLVFFISTAAPPL